MTGSYEVTDKTTETIQASDAKPRKYLPTIIFLTSFFLVGIVFRYAGENLFPELYVRIKPWVLIPAYTILGICGIILCRDVFIEGLRQWKKHPVKNVLILLGCFFGNLIFPSLAAIPGAVLYPDYESINESNVADIVGECPFFLIITALAVLGPICEEIIFRIFLVDKLSKKTKIPVAVAVIISSVIFAAGHMHSFSSPEILANLPIAVTGLIFAVSFVWSKNITIPAIVHVANNTMAMSLMYLSFMTRILC